MDYKLPLLLREKMNKSTKKWHQLIPQRSLTNKHSVGKDNSLIFNPKMWKWIFVVAVCRFEVARIIGCFMHASQLIFYFYVNSFCASNKSCGRRDWDKPLHGGCRRADVVHLKTAANRGREGETGEVEGETYKVIGLAFIFFYCKLNWSRSLWIFPFPSLLPSLFSVCWINQPLPTLSVSFTLSFLYQGQVFLSLQPSLPLLLQPTLSLSAGKMNIRHSDRQQIL